MKRYEQSSLLVRGLLQDAIAYIDNELGDGYAKAHPELVAVFMQASAQLSVPMFLPIVGETK